MQRDGVVIGILLQPRNAWTRKLSGNPPTDATDHPCNLHSFDRVVHNLSDLRAAPRMTSEDDNPTLQWAAQDGSDCESTWRFDINSSNLRAVPRMTSQHDNCAFQRAVPHVRQFVSLSDPSEASWSERMLDEYEKKYFRVEAFFCRSSVTGQANGPGVTEHITAGSDSQPCRSVQTCGYHKQSNSHEP